MSTRYSEYFQANLDEWFNSLRSGNADQFHFMPPLNKETMEVVHRIRGINEDLRRQREEEEERKAREAAEGSTVDPAVAATAAAAAAAATDDKDDESDYEEIISPAKNTQSANMAIFMPSKKEDADESLFTKYG